MKSAPPARKLEHLAALLYVYDQIVSSIPVKKHRYDELKQLVSVRMRRHSNYFQTHDRLISIHHFLEKVIDNLANRQYNKPTIENAST